MNIAVYCGSNAGKDPRFTEAARRLGAWIARSGHALVYGGSSIGLMGIVSRAVLDAGGEAYGVEPRFFIEAGVQQHDLTHLYIVNTMAERKAKMIELSDAFVALPGGVGTLEEIAEIMSRLRLGLSAQPCCFLNIAGYYDPMKQLLDSMLGQGFIAQLDRERIHFPESVEACAKLLEEGACAPQPAVATASELSAGQQDHRRGRNE